VAEQGLELKVLDEQAEGFAVGRANDRIQIGPAAVNLFLRLNLRGQRRLALAGLRILPELFVQRSNGLVLAAELLCKGRKICLDVLPTDVRWC
jgi:hypothetical protein